MNKNNVFPFPVMYNDEMLNALTDAIFSTNSFADSIFGKQPKLPNHFLGENDDINFIDVALPGHFKNTISVLAKNGHVYVDAQSNGLHGELVEDYHFYFEMPAGADEAKVSAVILNGILSIKFPKQEAKTIQVTVQ